MIDPSDPRWEKKQAEAQKSIKGHCTTNQHTMAIDRLRDYCESKIHTLFRVGGPDVVRIVPEYRRDKLISASEKLDKRFNCRRPTADTIGNVGNLYVFPGRDYVRHHQLIYESYGFKVHTDLVTPSDTRGAVERVFPRDFPNVDTVIIGYVEPLINGEHWTVNEDIDWQVQRIGATTVAFVGVRFSYWGDIVYYLIEQLARHTQRVIYIGKLGSLHPNDTPNKTIASGDCSIVEGVEVVWKNMFAANPLVSYGQHITVPAVLDETAEWFIQHQDSYRFVDPEIGWAAKGCVDNGLEFSYLHLVTDNLCGRFLEDLTNERNPLVLEKRSQYVNMIKSILWATLVSTKPSMGTAVQKAQQARVDRGLLHPLKQNWKACLSFAYHTQEEAWELVRELPRREWKDQVVIPERVLAELADTQIQLLTTALYAGFTEQDLHNAVLAKLGAKRKDWK